VNPYALFGAALAFLALLAGLLWYRGEALSAESKLVEFKAAYTVLADRAKACSAGAYDAEQAAKRAAEKGLRARQEAAGAVEVATRSAEALGRALAAPRTGGACPQADAVRVTREDLRR